MTNESEPVEPEFATPEPPAADEPAPAVEPAEPSPEATPPEGPPPRKRRLLTVFTYLAAVVVPAVVVGLVLFLLLGGDAEEDGSAAVVDTFLRLGTTDVEEVFSYREELPPGYPADLPAYPDAGLVAAFFVPTPQGGVFFAYYTTTDLPSAVTAFFEATLDEDPWQVQGAHRGSQEGGLAFNRPADIDVDGSITARRSDFGGTTSIIVQFQDLTPDATQAETPDEEFVLPESMALPDGFPEDIAIYAGSEGPSTVTDIAYQRSPGSADFLVTFLTEDDQADVIDYYQREFESRGWTVSDAAVSPSSFTLGIEFSDDNDELQGTLTADIYEKDSRYTQVDLLVFVSPTRGRGN